MRRALLHTLLHTLLPALLLAVGASAAASDPRYEVEAAKLDRLRAQIQEIKQQLARERERRGDLSGELREIDQKVGQIASRLRRLDERYAEKQRRVGDLRKEFVAEEQRMAQHREFLSRQLVTAYAGGQQTFIKLLLNQEDPARLDRMLAYHRYFNRARIDRINAAVAQLQRLSVIEKSLQDELAGLDEVRQQQQIERQNLEAARVERGRALARIEAAIAAKGQELSRLHGDEQQLQRLLESLRDALADVPDPRKSQRPFKGSRGELGWPLEGRLAARFGQARGVGDMRWSGVLIEGKEGSGVRAVSHGHVVFADWLRGFGLLLIIDHGDGFMTLYGHNEAIYKEAGDWVQPGDVIATVGASGGRHHAGLYFEIRAGGKPVDPLEWLRPKRSG